MKPSDRPVSSTRGAGGVDGLARRAHPFDRQLEGEERLLDVAGGVFDRQPRDTGGDGPGDVGGHLFRGFGEAALEVGVHRHVHRVDDDLQVRQHGSSATWLSACPIDHAMPALVVASAGNPSCASTRALPASHGLGITKQPEA